MEGTINRAKYLNRNKRNSNFEIVTIEQFFETRPKKLIETDFRIDFWLLMYITKGCGTHSIDFVEYSYTAGDLIVIPKNRVHSFRVNHEIEGYMININEPVFFERGEKRDMDMLAFFESPYGKPIFPIDISKNTTNRQLIDLIYKEYLIPEDENSNDLIKTLFLAFVYAIRRENKDKIRQFSESMYRYYYEYQELVEENFTKIKSVDEYAKLIGLSKKTINAACRECVDVSAKQLINDRIILEAKRLIVCGELKNYEISELLGFDEPTNFANFFKRYTGMSMREFSKNNRR